MTKPTSIARAITFFSRQEVQALFHTARTVIKEKGLEIRRTPAQKPFGRILIIIPKKVGSAPVRNLIRRRIKAIFYQEKLYDNKYDGIIFVTKNASVLSFIELKELLKKSFTYHAR